MDSRQILERVLELSKLQLGYFEQRRYPELVRAQIERGELFVELDKVKGGIEERESLADLRDGILESDKELAILLGSEKNNLSDKLKKTAKGSTVLKAYAGRINR